MYQLDLGVSVRLFEPYGKNENYLRDLKEIRRQGFKSVEVTLGKVGGYKVNMEQCMMFLHND